MYEHPMKRAGLSMNRILFSNTRMVQQGFPKLDQTKMGIHYKLRTFSQGKQVGSSISKNTQPLISFVFSLHGGRSRHCHAFAQGRVITLD